MNDTWQTNWKLFVDLVATRIRDGDGPQELTQLFGGKQVTWSGRLLERHKTEDVLLVTISLPSTKAALGFCRTAILDTVSARVALDAISEWISKEIGSEITFVARFRGSDALFPAISVEHFWGGKSVIMIGLVDATLVTGARSTS